MIYPKWYINITTKYVTHNSKSCYIEPGGLKQWGVLYNRKMLKKLVQVASAVAEIDGWRSSSSYMFGIRSWVRCGTRLKEKVFIFSQQSGCRNQATANRPIKAKWKVREKRRVLQWRLGSFLSVVVALAEGDGLRRCPTDAEVFEGGDLEARWWWALEFRLGIYIKNTQ